MATVGHSTAAEREGRIGVLIVDDHPMLRDGVAAVIGAQLDMVVVGEAANGATALDRYRDVMPDIVLMDLQMPEVDGVAAIGNIIAEFPDAQIIVLTTYSGDAKALRALKAGAAGYMLKSSLRAELIEVIRSVFEGKRHLPPEVATQIALHAADDHLSPREVSILSLIAAGNANKRVAWKLDISEDTVKTHLKHIYAKLGVTDRTHAVTIAAKRGLIEL